MQAVRGRDECSKPYTPPSRHYSTIQALPIELLVEIFQHLDWEDVLVTRRTCKFFFDISTSRPLWVFLFYRMSSELQIPPILERPISAYTAVELEQVVMRRVSSEIGWATGATPCLHILSTPEWPREEGDTVILLDGGRWILTCMNRDDWCVYAYDLDMSLAQEPRCIIDLEIDDLMETNWRMAVSLDRNARPELAFNVCLAPRSPVGQPALPTNWVTDGILMYHLTVKGSGTGAILEAHKLKSFGDGVRNDADVIALHGNYLVKCIESLDSYDYSFEVWNWFLSDSNLHFKCCISDVFDVVLTPDGKLIAFTSSEILIYDVTTLHPSPAGKIDGTLILQPYWRHTDVRLSGQLLYSQSYSDPHTVRVALAIDGAVLGLTVPHNIDNKPYIRQISNISVSDTPMACIGINKMYAYDCHQWTDKSGIRTVNFPWPDEDDVPCNVSWFLPAVKQSSQHQLRLPFRWNFPPFIDESSNRILTFGPDSWAIVDFAYK